MQAKMIDPKSVTEIISSKEMSVDLLPKNLNGVSKTHIPIDMTDFAYCGVTTVEPGTEVRDHCHKIAVFRYVIEGSFIMNGVEYVSGDWTLVPAGTNYSTRTKTGYKVFYKYKTSDGSQCEI